MTKPKKKIVDINQLDINIENPRFAPAISQRDAIIRMVKDQMLSGGQNKLLKIAKHILSKGLNPHDLPYITTSPTTPKHYVVLEGNRRITALKLLREPKILEDVYPSLTKKFNALAKNTDLSIFDRIECSFYDNEEDAKIWIELKHTGENDGIGTDGWDYEQQQRYKGNSAITEIIDYVKLSNDIEPDIKEKLSKVRYTNLERLLRDVSGKKFLGLKLKDGKYFSTCPTQEFNKGLSAIIDRVSKPAFKVTDIYYKEDRAKFFNKIPKYQHPKGKSVAEWPVSNPPASTKPSIKKAKSRDKPKSTERASLIPNDFKISIKETKAHNIYKELKALDAEEYSNAVAVLFRVFIELSVDSYLSNKPEIKTRNNDRLKDKIKKVCNNLEDKKILKSEELTGARELTNTEESYLSVNTFHAFVHNIKYSPSPFDLKVKWDNLQPFIKSIWGTK